MRTNGRRTEFALLMAVNLTTNVMLSNFKLKETNWKNKKLTRTTYTIIARSLKISIYLLYP